MRERATAMLDRATAEARAVVGDAGAAIVRAALHCALAPRDDLFDNDHDSRLLHPGRTIRILIADAGCRSAETLAAAALVDSVDTELGERARRDARGAGVPDDVLDLAATAPLPRAGLADAGDGAGDAGADDDDDDLLERLVTASEDAALIALAERLDHARHLHLRDDLDRRAFHANARSVYAAAARRLSPPIARRFEHWADAFERRLVMPGR